MATRTEMLSMLLVGTIAPDGGRCSSRARPTRQRGAASRPRPRITAVDDAEIAFDERGLVPCVVQDWRSGEVLTVAYMNAEALRRTRESGQMHFYSRSRRELWHKGASSGHTQALRSLRLDCDGDTLLALVEPAGPACHTGERTCFHRGELEPTAPHEVLPALERTIAARAQERPQGSYTASLLGDPALAGAKVREEAEEVTRAVREESDQRVAEEAADVIYHLAVLLRGRGLGLADAERVLDDRRR
jgi:phosphoribosyl-ATP pyrophosphohydrolase/phosphoribosyl-AMP cyclohydrolase